MRRTDGNRDGGRGLVWACWPAEARSFDFQKVSGSYAAAADRIGGLLFPVGEAWLDARELTSSTPGLPGVSADDLTTLRQAAHRTNIDHRRAHR